MISRPDFSSPAYPLSISLFISTGLPPQAHICQLCFKLFPSPTALETHFQTEHTKEAANRSTPHSSGSGGSASNIGSAAVATQGSSAGEGHVVNADEEKNLDPVAATSNNNHNNTCDASSGAQAPLYDNKVSSKNLKYGISNILRNYLRCVASLSKYKARLFSTIEFINLESEFLRTGLDRVQK